MIDDEQEQEVAFEKVQLRRGTKCGKGSPPKCGDWLDHDLQLGLGIALAPFRPCPQIGQGHLANT